MENQAAAAPDADDAAEVIKRVKADNPGKKLERIINPDFPDVLVIARAPTREEWTAYRAMLVDDQQRAAAFEVFTLGGPVLYPSRLELKRLYAERPGLPASIAGELNEMAGLSMRMRREKL